MSQQSLFQDTIFALSSGRLPSGVAIIRISGNGVREALERLAGGVPAPRRASYRHITSADGLVLDQGLVIYFPNPHSFTGEDCAELQVHGGRAVVASILDALGSLPYFRLAEAGEFTRRAFLNGRIDLTGAEALSDLIAAETESQRRMALTNAEGGQRDLYASWRSRLIHARAMVEAELDFADESDVPGSVSVGIQKDLDALCEEINRHCEGFRTAEMIRDGYRVVLLGAPNAGKSSLLNALARRDVAIVTEQAGTTRDLIEVSLDLQGIKVVVTDTAGIRESIDIVERIGIDRAKKAASEADLVVEVVDLTSAGARALNPGLPHVLRVGTKSDLGEGTVKAAEFDHVISVVSGAGIEELLTEIGKNAALAAEGVADILPSRKRHVQLLAECSGQIGLALCEDALELRAERLRLAADSLGKISGDVDVEDLLDVIFSQFCIGK